MRSHWPIGPNLVPLANVILSVYTLDNFGFWGSELQNLSETTDIFVPVSSNASVVKF